MQSFKLKLERASFALLAPAGEKLKDSCCHP